MPSTAYRDPGTINGLDRRTRIGIAVLNGGLELVWTLVPVARRFLPPEVHLIHDEIDTLFAAVEPLRESCLAVLGADHELTRAATSAPSTHPETTVYLWRAVSALPTLTCDALAAATGQA